MSDAFRFLHGSDFRLDQPMKNLATIPAHLRSIIADAPYTAATRFFDLALTEAVDFVLLSGDLLDSSLGSCRPAAFLLNQFDRLREKGIMVYWCAGKIDQPDRWPAGVELPDNVVCFTASIVEEATVMRKEKAVATIVGAAYDSRRETTADFLVESTAPFPIALTHGVIGPSTTLARNIQYWAVGGSHKSAISERNAAHVVQAGTQQSRSADESGSHGCFLIRVDQGGIARVVFHELDQVRWLPQNVSISESASLEELQNVLAERAMKLVADNPDRLLLVPWRISTTDAFDSEFRAEKRTELLLKWLRDEFGRVADGLWSTSITISPPENLPSGWYEEDTILGDFLRAVGRYQSDESLNIALHEYLPAHVDDAAAAPVIRVAGESRARVLSATAVLGAGYLALGRDGSESV